MKDIKTYKYIKIILLVMIIISNAGVQAYSEKKVISIDVVKDGKISKKINLYLINKMGYLSARDIAEVFKSNFNYNGKQKKIVFKWPAVKKEDNGNREVIFEIGSEYVVMDGIKRKMMKRPQIIDGHIYIPLEAIITRAFESVVGAQVNWNYSKKALWISYHGNIADVRGYSYGNYTRYVVELTKDLNYNIKKKNGFLELFIKQGALALPAEDIKIKEGVIVKIDISDDPDGVRFLINTTKDAGEYKVKKLPSPTRIVLDIEDKGKSVSEIKSASETKPIDELPMAPAGPPKRDKANIKDIKLVVIDPGHGGKDPGAIGPRGTKEKEIVLNVAKKLARKIRKKLKIRTILTRSHDVFIPLAERTEIANSHNADIFISIHTNASLNPKSRGVEVYFLSEDTSDKEAQAVANMENSVMAMEDRSHEKNKVSRILWSLTMNQFMNESSELCGFTIRNAVNNTGLIHRGVKQAGFYVMRGARMPAVLIEIGFLSNKKEEKLLSRESFQEKMANAICNSIKEYRTWVRRR